MADMEVDELPLNTSFSSRASETKMEEDNSAETAATSLSPEKSLFGNSADKLRESNLDVVDTNGNSSPNEKESNGTKQDEEEMNVSKDEEDTSKDESLENKMDISMKDEKGDKPPATHDKDPPAKDDKEEIEDKAGEEVCIKRAVTPLTDNEKVDDAVEDTEEMAEEEDESSAIQETPEEEAPSTRRSSRRSNAAPAKTPTPKAAVSKNARKAKVTPAATEKEEEVEEETAEGDVEKTEEEVEATPAGRRSLRTPKSATKEVKTPASGRGKKQPVKEEEGESTPAEEPASGRRRSTRAVAIKKEEPAKVTPASSARGKKRGAPKDEEETTKEEDDEESKAAKTPAKRIKKEDSTPQRGSARSKSSSAKKGKATPAEDVQTESEKEHSEEEEEAAEEEVEQPKKTPKRAPQKRGAATEKRVTKPRKRKASEPGDSNDPYNFDNKNESTGLFRNINLKLNANGAMQFSRNLDAASSSSSKYASLEKNSTERRSLMLEGSTSITSTPGSSKAPAKKTPAKRGGRGAPKESHGDEDATEAAPAKTPKTKTPKVEPEEKKPKEQPPTLTAEEQVLADDESNAHYPKGARVYGIWGKEYYSAIIDDSDGLGRCKLFYTEDLSVRTIPRAGVIPIHLVKEGSEVGVIGEEIDGEKAAYEGKVLSIPSIKNTEEWHRGLFTIEITKEDEEVESRQVEWFDIYFTESQYKHIIKNVKNPTAVDQDNVIEGSGRRTRRSTAAVATPAATTTPRAKPGPKPKKKIEEVPDETATPETEEPQKKEAPAKPAAKKSAVKDSSKIFDNLQFILTSANRESGPPPFTKKEVRKQIESRGGTVVENFDDVDKAAATYLIADTFYRTHKYLTALSLSIPTVSFKWITKCVEDSSLVDHEDFMLDAGESETTHEVYKWKPLKGQILPGKKIAVYSRRKGPLANNPIDFCQIWSPIVTNLGADLVDKFPAELEKAIEYFKKKDIVDYFVADDETPPELVNAVYEGGAIPVTSEFLIQTVITGKLAATDAGTESYIIKPKH